MSDPTISKDEISQEEKLNRITEVIIKKIEIHKILERQDEQQKMLDAVIHELGNTNQSMNQLVTQINQVFSGVQQQAQAPSMEIPQMGNTSPELKLQTLSSVLPAISDIVRTIKGSNAPQNNGGWFEDFSKQIIANMLQAGVDGMMRNVYENYNPIPPRPISTQLKPTNHQLE